MPASKKKYFSAPDRKPINVRGADVIVREAVPDDCDRMFALVEELAVYERAADQVDITSAQVYDCCFGPRAFCGAFVAEWQPPASGKQPVIIGMAIYFYRFHTWKGRQIYLEEFVVSDVYRGSGVGKRLFDRVMEQGRKEKCTSMFWQALDWNEPALNFYRKYKSEIDPGWVNCTLTLSSKM